jgi:hypothetical protein
MSNRYARILAAGGAAVLMATLSVTTALAAATTWTIQSGGGIQAMSGPFTFKDTTTGTVGKCASSTASGMLKSGTGLPGSHAGSLSAVSFANCSGAGGEHFALHPAGLPWRVNFSSYNAATEVVRGTISHLRITNSADGCNFLIDGTSATGSDGKVTFKYADSTGQLAVLTTSGNLHIYDVSDGCLGLVNDGNPVVLSATYTVTPKQVITSP